MERLELIKHLSSFKKQKATLAKPTGFEWL